MKDYVRHTRGRMFESDFFEFFSKVHPSMPFFFWIPIVAFAQVWGLYRGVTTWALSLAFFPLGWVTWQLMEYFIHKKVFHWEGSGPFSRRFHAIVHGFHHKYPDDDSRLVMPLAVSIGLAGAIGGGLYFLHRPDVTIPWWTGLLFGYLWYDFLHWSTHFRKPLTGWGRKLRSHHMSHHFADHESNFGISNMWIDGVMGTLKKRAQADESND
jgi:sterol desaturase/sphingolipid hydroxylase (fatty acid hydroxylase superfamily)